MEGLVSIVTPTKGPLLEMSSPQLRFFSKEKYDRALHGFDFQKEHILPEEKNNSWVLGFFFETSLASAHVCFRKLKNS